MSILEDILTALDRIPIWKRLQGVPHEVDELKRRMEALEKLVDGKVPSPPCPFCGGLKYRLERADMHGRREVWKCGDCDQSRDYRIDLGQKSPTSR